MHAATPRYAVLIALTGVGLLLLTGAERVAPGSALVPTDDELFGVAGWHVSPPSEAVRHSVHFSTRSYWTTNGGSAELSIKTSPEAKRIYRTGADIPFLGSGLSVESPPPGTVSPAAGMDALIVRTDERSWLLLYTFGERRGPLGNGPLGWGLAIFDSLIGHPNDYYLLLLFAPVEPEGAVGASDVVALGDAVFPRLAAWYRDAGAFQPVLNGTQMRAGQHLNS